MRRTAIGLTSWQLVVIGSNPIRSDKCRSLAQFGLEHKYLKKPHKMLGWTSWLSHKIFMLAFRSSNLLPSTKKNAALAKLVRRHFLKVKTRWFEPNMQYKCGSSSVG